MSKARCEGTDPRASLGWPFLKETREAGAREHGQPGPGPTSPTPPPPGGTLSPKPHHVVRAQILARKSAELFTSAPAAAASPLTPTLRGRLKKRELEHR